MMLNSGPTRRRVLAAMTGFLAVGVSAPALADDPELWDVQRAYDALKAGRIVLLDVRTRDEWAETGVAEGAWPVSLHERSFGPQITRTIQILDGRRLALICATGGRSAYVRRLLRQSGVEGTIDVTEGMLGSRAGPGWIKAGLPVVSMEEALAILPPEILEN